MTPGTIDILSMIKKEAFERTKEYDAIENPNLLHVQSELTQIALWMAKWFAEKWELYRNSDWNSSGDYKQKYSADITAEELDEAARQILERK